MVVEPLKPQRGGFLRPFGCGWFIREFLLGNSPGGSTQVNPYEGSPQATIFRQYKIAIMRATSMERAIKTEERNALREKRLLNPDNITLLANHYLARMPYKAQGCRSHSFTTYFSDIKRLGWVEPTGRVERSEFQDHYPPGPARRYYRLTQAGKQASDRAWANPHSALYG